MAENKTPIVNGVNGRRPDGTFAPGNPGGPGNPSLRRTRKIENAFRAAVTDKDLRALAKALLEKAKRGDVAAAIAVLDRVLGKPVSRVEMLTAMREGDGPQFSGGIRIQIIEPDGSVFDSVGELPEPD